MAEATVMVLLDELAGVLDMGLREVRSGVPELPCLSTLLLFDTLAVSL